MHKITQHTFYKYLKCPSWIEKEMDRGEVVDELRTKLLDEGLLRETELGLLEGREYVEVDMPDLDEAAQKTVELMKQGVQTIYHGILIDGHWVGSPDLLERVEGKSEFGNWYYIACDMKRSHRLKDEYKIQGAFYAEILHKIQRVRPARGFVMHTDGRLDDYDIDDVYTQFHITLDAIEDILVGQNHEHFFTAGCKQSPYFSECHEETKKCDDLSLINRIWKSEAKAFSEAGFNTIEKLASASVDRLHKVSGVTMDRIYVLQQQAIALADDRTVVLGSVDLPEESGVALVIDIESDPLRDVDYLFGVLVVDGEDEVYHPFLAKKPEDAEKVWKEFVSFLSDYGGANIYHYGWYEYDVFYRLSERYGAPAQVKQMFEENMIDVLDRIREKVIFPLSFYSLKDVAKHLGFSWRIADASGIDSIIWYHEWLKDGEESVLQDIVEYNEDDVRATWIVRNWAVKNT
ncbi:TM0106 family RecB-like putative nuclease [Patescibacteria group bacterium]|nr:TM0106 family RecB-like putative nuclease [Patescibacteria group bacterium]